MCTPRALVSAAAASMVAPAKADSAVQGELGGVPARGTTVAEAINGKRDVGNEIDSRTHQAGCLIQRAAPDFLHQLADATRVHDTVFGF